MTCNYCEGPIDPDDTDPATWGREEERPRPRSPRFGYGYAREPSTVVATVMLCERCREVCTVRELLRMLEEQLAKEKRRRRARE